MNKQKLHRHAKKVTKEIRVEERPTLQLQIFLSQLRSHPVNKTLAAAPNNVQ